MFSMFFIAIFYRNNINFFIKIATFFKINLNKFYIKILKILIYFFIKYKISIIKIIKNIKKIIKNYILYL